MDYLATSAPEPGLPYTALLAGHDTLACGYYLRAAPGSDIDWTRLLAQREALRVSGSRGFEVVSLGDAEFLLQLSRGIQISPVMGIENSPPGSRFGLFGTNEAGLQLLLEPIRIAANVERHRVMQ